MGVGWENEGEGVIRNHEGEGVLHDVEVNGLVDRPEQKRGSAEINYEIIILYILIYFK